MTLKNTCSILRQALGIISKPLVNSNWNYRPKMLNLGQNQRIFFLWNIEVWWMTSKNNRAPLPNYAKLYPLFQSHQWIHIGVTVWKCSIRVKICNFFILCDLEIWWMTLKNNRAPFLYCFKLCASFYNHLCIWIGVTVWKTPIWAKSIILLSHVTLKFDLWSWEK